MKKSIIEEIYLDNQSLSEKVKPSEEYKKVSDESYGFYEQLNKILNDEQKEIFEKFANSEMGVCAEAELMHFKEGVKVGFLFAIECLH